MILLETCGRGVFKEQNNCVKAHKTLIQISFLLLGKEGKLAIAPEF